MRHKLRVLLADDHRSVLAGLKAVLRQDQSLEVVGEASNGRMAVDLARKLLPDVIVMDIRMPALNGVEATRLILSHHPGISVIGLSLHADSNLGVEMQKAGASACISKGAPVQALISAIQACRT